MGWALAIAKLHASAERVLIQKDFEPMIRFEGYSVLLVIKSDKNQTCLHEHQKGEKHKYLFNTLPLYKLVFLMV